MDKNTIHFGASILLVNARLNALENILWGYLNPELDEIEPGYSKEYRQMFYEFYIEHICELRNKLPDALANNAELKNILDMQIQDSMNQIDFLK